MHGHVFCHKELVQVVRLVAHILYIEFCIIQQVVDVSNDGYVSIMDDNGELREDLKLSQDSTVTLENLQKLLNDDNNYVTVSIAFCVVRLVDPLL